MRTSELGHSGTGRTGRKGLFQLGGAIGGAVQLCGSETAAQVVTGQTCRLHIHTAPPCGGKQFCCSFTSWK
ncbi:hypothetical protein ATANTOWER_007024, partial [Ataeniobius toweri]|nr:hypothetical protein [Ataeniobius toweri]